MPNRRSPPGASGHLDFYLYSGILLVWLPVLNHIRNIPPPRGTFPPLKHRSESGHRCRCLTLAWPPGFAKCPLSLKFLLGVGGRHCWPVSPLHGVHARSWAPMKTSPPQASFRFQLAPVQLRCLEQVFANLSCQGPGSPSFRARRSPSRQLHSDVGMKSTQNRHKEPTWLSSSNTICRNRW